jgi:hypothetical protein
VKGDPPARGTPITDGRFTKVGPARIYFVEGSPVSAYVVVDNRFRPTATFRLVYVLFVIRHEHRDVAWF